MKPIDFIEAIGWGVDNGLIEYPDNYSDIVANPPIIAQSWVYMEWEGPDKPSWVQIAEWSLCVQIHRLINPQEGHWEKAHLKQQKSELLKEINRKDSGYHLSTLDKMPNLIKISQSRKPINVVLRKSDGTLDVITSAAKLRKIIDIVSANQNNVEIAHNTVKSRYHRLVKTAYDKNLIQETRLEAATEAGQINRNYSNLLRAEI